MGEFTRTDEGEVRAYDIGGKNRNGRGDRGRRGGKDLSLSVIREELERAPRWGRCLRLGPGSMLNLRSRLVNLKGVENETAVAVERKRLKWDSARVFSPRYRQSGKGC